MTPGQKLDHYEIRDLLGSGGMGEVYRAFDTTLEREVAIKVLPRALAQDPERLARFEREAKILAALNHPNIATVHGLLDSDGRRALVMELVPGETLTAIFQRGPLRLEDTLKIARQIAEALEAAHEKAVVHRDVKPGNVMRTPTGLIKVLDFGLAAIVLPAPATPSDPHHSPTLTIGGTIAGTILGTASYMSPEQAEGIPVDKRADIWSFGVVLWEMLTGKRLFDAGSISRTLADVLRKEIDFSQLPAETPAPVRELLKRCLDRDVQTRLRDIGEARVAIQKYVAEPVEQVPKVPDPPPPTAPTRPWLWIGATAAATMALLALGYVHYFRPPANERRMVKLFLPYPANERLNVEADRPAVSPDGRHIAFSASLDGKLALWVRDLDALNARALSGTEGARLPFWSPDSRAIGFFAEGRLKRIDVDGGPALVLCASGTNPRGGSWSKDSEILFTPDNTHLFRISATGGAPATVMDADPAQSGAGFRSPWFLPDGHHFLYTRRYQDRAKTTILVGDLDSKARKAVVTAASNAVYTPPGYLLFLREQTLMAQPFDAVKAQTTGDAVTVAEEVSYSRLDQTGSFSVSQDGILAYVGGGILRNGPLLTWLDRSGKVLGTVGGRVEEGVTQGLALSPDGTSVVDDRPDPQIGRRDLWLHDLARGGDSRFTIDTLRGEWPVWSPDGAQIVFHSGDGELKQKATSGAAVEESLDKDARIQGPSDWSRDGRYILELRTGDPKTGSDIWVLPLNGDRKPYPYLHSEFNETNGRLSPNGQWLAYSSNDTKREEIYVVTFPTPGGKWQVSTNGGGRPVWSRDGKELYFIGADQKLMAVEIKGGAKFEHTSPKPLFDTRLSQNARFDVSKDGRFLMPVQPVSETGKLPITVVVNWTAGLKK